MIGQVKALFLLALSLVLTLFRRIFAKSALPQFAQHYGSEGILPLTAGESELLSRASQCNACGRCDAHEGPRVAQSAHGYQGMMHFALSGCRSLPEYDASARTLSEVPEEAFAVAAALCPSQVPLVELAALVRGYAKRRGKALGH